MRNPKSLTPKNWQNKIHVHRKKNENKNSTGRWTACGIHWMQATSASSYSLAIWRPIQLFAHASGNSKKIANSDKNLQVVHNRNHQLLANSTWCNIRNSMIWRKSWTKRWTWWTWKRWFLLNAKYLLCVSIPCVEMCNLDRWYFRRGWVIGLSSHHPRSDFD